MIDRMELGLKVGQMVRSMKVSIKEERKMEREF
jgi:hypothetical protein